MRIKGKLCLEELKLFMCAFGVALAIGSVIYGFFALLSLMSWVLAWVTISTILTPVVFWIIQYLREKIVIEDDNETEETSIRITDSYE